MVTKERAPRILRSPDAEGDIDKTRVRPFRGDQKKQGQPDLDEVEPRSASDDVCIAAMKQVLKEHGALDRFGIMLIHGHFDMAEDERLIETVDAVNRTL